MNLDATVISFSLIATGVATCILLGNPQMDKRYTSGESDLEKSLPSLSPASNQENASEKLQKLESEVADLKHQMDVLAKRMAETNPTLPNPQPVSGNIDQEAIGYAGPHD